MINLRVGVAMVIKNSLKELIEMKKILSAVLLAAVLAVLPVSVQAEASFDLNRDFNSKFVPVSTIYSGRVVGISTYLSLRESPSEYSEEVMRIPNGAKLTLRHNPRAYENGWWEVLSVTFNGRTYEKGMGYGIGYVSVRYVSTR